MLLNEYAAKMGFTCETECKRLWQDGNSSGVARFVARVKLCGHLVAEEEGFSKQEASNKASVAAMGGVMEEAPSDWGQSMRSLIMGKFAELLRPETRSIVFPTVCAGIVCSMPGREPFVVSLGAGTVHMPLVERGEFPSEILHDCHAEMLCKRGLRSYFMQQIYLAQTGDQSSIFAKRPPGVTGSPYQLRPNVTFHLFISSPPCGDAACCVGKVDQEGGGGRPIGVRPMHGIPSMGGSGRSLPSVEESLSQNWRGDGHWPGFGRSSTQGKLRAKLDSGESLTPLPPPVRPGGDASSSSGASGGSGGGAVPAKAGGVNGRMCKMSCSDKLLRINALGIQGSLLSHFLNAPIHISSVTCGDGTDGGGGQGVRRSMYCHAEIARAICCRLGRGRTDGASAIPPLVLNQPYYVNHPALHRASASAPPPPRGLETGGAGHGIKRADRAAVWSQGGKMELLCHARGGGGVSGKTPVQLLQELCQSAPGVEGAVAEWEVVVGKAGGFDAKVIALGAVGQGSGGSKVEARQKAARVLLEIVGVCFMGKGSRVSQARQFDDFKWLVGGEPDLAGEGLGKASQGGFRGAKRGGRGYLEAKGMLLAYLEQTFEQTWIERGPIVVNVRGADDASGAPSSASASSINSASAAQAPLAQVPLAQVPLPQVPLPQVPLAQVPLPQVPLPSGAGSPAVALGPAAPSSLVVPTEV